MCECLRCIRVCMKGYIFCIFCFSQFLVVAKDDAEVLLSRKLTLSLPTTDSALKLYIVHLLTAKSLYNLIDIHKEDFQEISYMHTVCVKYYIYLIHLSFIQKFHCRDVHTLKTIVVLKERLSNEYNPTYLQG